MRRVIISFFSIIFLYLLQVTIFSNLLDIGGIAPNLVLMFSCICGFMRGRTAGTLVGFFGGLLVDILGGGVVGFSALAFMYSGFFNGMFHKEYSKEQILLPIGLIFLCDFAYGFISYITKALIYNRLNFGFYLGKIIIPEAVYTVFVTLFSYVIIYYINRKFLSYDKAKKARALANYKETGIAQ